MFFRTRPLPTASTRSALTRKVAASRVIVLAEAPTESGWFSGKALLATIEVVTGAWSSSASSRSSSVASAQSTPWPAMISGRWAASSKRAASATSPGSPAER